MRSFSGTTSDRSGVFRLSLPLPGVYVLQVEQRLFAPARLDLAVIGGEAPPLLRIVLQVASLTQSVDVRAPRLEERASSLALGQDASPLEVPASVSAVGMHVLREQGGTTLQDALRLVPGAQPDFGFIGGQSQVFVLRGSLADSGTGSSRVLRDGARLSNYAFVPAFAERIDALRGPGSAVGVRSEPGGTVNVVSKQPGLVNSGEVSVGVGSRGMLATWGDVNRVISAEHELSVRLLGNQSNQDEWRKVPNHLSGLKLGVAKGGGDRYTLRFGYERTHQVYQPDFGVPAVDGRPANIPRDRQLGEPWDDSQIDNHIADLSAEIALPQRTRLAFNAAHLRGHSVSRPRSPVRSPRGYRWHRRTR